MNNRLLSLSNMHLKKKKTLKTQSDLEDCDNRPSKLSRGGSRKKASATRNSYKDKGGRSSHSSKMQKQLRASWS
ncbi:hypothetical protein OROHE_024991 [Orobanche hederae]